MTSTSRWNKKGHPHNGYQPASIIDSGEVTNQCDMCGTSIRYLHNIYHPEAKLDITVGCCCAEKLCEAYEGAIFEAELRRKADKKLRWVRKEPKSIEVDGATCTVDKFGGDLVVVFEEHGVVSYIVEQKDGDILKSTDTFDNFLDAREEIASMYLVEGWV